MSPPDAINGAFELFAGAMVLNHCRVMVAHGGSSGVSAVSVAFFAAWGVWNLYYYPHLDQWASFAGGIGVVVANLVQVAMILAYRRKKGGRHPRVRPLKTLRTGEEYAKCRENSVL